MSSRKFFRPRILVGAALVSLGLTTAASFVRAQIPGPNPNGPGVPANTVTFGSGAGLSVRGTPLANRGAGFAYSLPGNPPPYFGAWMRPAPLMPNTPIPPKALGQNPTPSFFNPAAAAAGQGVQMQGGAIGMQGGQQGQQGGIGGGIQGGGISGGTAGGIQGGGAAGALGAGGGGAGGLNLGAQGQNFQNPTGNLGFPQVPNPQGYIGGFTGGQITGAGIAGNTLGGIGLGGAQGQGGGIGGFGGGGIGGKGAGFAGGNGA